MKRKKEKKREKINLFALLISSAKEAQKRFASKKSLKPNFIVSLNQQQQQTTTAICRLIKV
jgi:hypothetical protein